MRENLTDQTSHDLGAIATLEEQDGQNWLASLLARHVGLRMLHIVSASLGTLVVLSVVFLLIMNGRFVPLTAQSPSLEVDSYLNIVLQGERPARVYVQTFDFGSASRRWQAARDAIPTYLRPVGDIYQVTGRGPGALSLVFNLPPEMIGSVALYRWDRQAGQWVFVPTTISESAPQLWADLITDPFALFRVEAAGPLISTVLEAEQTLGGAQAAAINILFVAGVEALSDGTLDTHHLTWHPSAASSYAVLPVLRVPDRRTLDDLLADRAALTHHAESIATLIAEREFDGVLLDYGAFDPIHIDTFNAMVEDLAAKLHAQNALLALRVPTPVYLDPGWDTGAYDWQYLGSLVDLLVVRLPGGPGDYYDGGPVDEFLSWATGQVDPVRLHVAFSSLCIDEWAGHINPISYQYALAPLGETALAPGVSASGLQPGQELSFRLDGEAVNIGQDPHTNVYFFDVLTDDGGHRIWIVTAASLRKRLDWIAARRIGGVIIEDLLAPDNSPGIIATVHEFKVNLPPSSVSSLSLHWKIQKKGGPVLLETTTVLGHSLTWTPEQVGEYVVSAALTGADSSSRGSLAVVVGSGAADAAPVQEGIVVGAPNVSASAGKSTSIPPPPDLPPPVIPPQVYGHFELGGQVNHVIGHPEYMRQAGMKWVKFQLAWSESMDARVAWELIERGRKEGFKVLLSITGEVKYPTEIDIEAYLDFLRGVAHYGADAIEVWNEQNLDYEWPRGQIDGGNYVREMLAPAYNAIKEVNPNTIVISGAPAPTGAFYAEGGCSLQGYGCDDWLYLQQMAQMGAANYMDCVGAHYNSGATSPSATTGHPADPGYQHYSWYFGGMLQLYGGTFGRPICFTELGYLTGEGYGAVPERYKWAANTTVAQQAAWLAEAAQIGKASGLVRLMIVWNVDFVYWGDDPMAGYAIVRPDGSCPACQALGNVMKP